MGDPMGDPWDPMGPPWGPHGTLWGSMGPHKDHGASAGQPGAQGPRQQAVPEGPSSSVRQAQAGLSKLSAQEALPVGRRAR